MNALIDRIFSEEFFSLKVLQLYFGFIILNLISGIHVIIITVVLAALVSSVLVVTPVLVVLIAHFYCSEKELLVYINVKDISVILCYFYKLFALSLKILIRYGIKAFIRLDIKALIT